MGRSWSWCSGRVAHDRPFRRLGCVTDEERRCAAGGKCAHREKKEGRWLGALLKVAEGLCDGCLSRVHRAIEGAANDVIELSELIGDSSQHVGEGRRTRDLPTPIRLGVEALRREIDFEVQYWAILVAEECGAEIGLDRRRLNDRVAHAASFLVHRVDKLLTMGPQEREAWTSDGEATSGVRIYTGLQGALRMIDLHNRVVRVAGRTDLVHRLTPACPYCDHKTLVRANGSSMVECENCHKQINERHYNWFVDAVIREEERRQREVTS